MQRIKEIQQSNKNINIRYSPPAGTARAPYNHPIDVLLRSALSQKEERERADPLATVALAAATVRHSEEYINLSDGSQSTVCE